MGENCEGYMVACRSKFQLNSWILQNYFFCIVGSSTAEVRSALLVV